jgi:hypothetical protein
MKREDLQASRVMIGGDQANPDGLMVMFGDYEQTLQLNSRY